MTKELNEIMDLDPLSLSKQDLDAIILAQRQQRASTEAGVKPKKAKAATAPHAESDIAAALANITVKATGELPPQANLVKRRI